MSVDVNDATPEQPDLFAEAFSKLAEMEDVPKPSEVSEVIANATSEPEPAQPVTEVEAAPEPAIQPETEEQFSEETVAEEAQPDIQEEIESEPTVSDDEILKRFAQLVKNANPEEERHVEPAVQQQTPEIYSPEERQFITEYEKDWPDVAKAEALRRKAEYQQLVGYVFQEVAKELRPVFDTVKDMAERTHLQDLQSTVNDYDDVRDRVIDWVAKQPQYLQPAYQHVIQQGTVDEVADLIGRYKRDTGASAPQYSQRSAPRRGSELPTATKQAAAALAPVSSKRSAVIQGVDQGDFDSAFAAFADKL